VVGRAQTDGDGKFVIEGEWPESLFVVTWGRKLRYITQTPTVELPVDLGDLRVEPTSGVTGRVVDTRGFPVAEARVQSVNLAADLLENFPLWQLLDAERVIYAPHADVIPAVAGFWRRLLNLPKSPTETAMLIRPRWLESLAELMPFVATKTDADGRFRLDGLSRRGTTTLVVTKDGYRVLVKDDVTVLPWRLKELEPALELTPASITRGEVRGSDGRPLVGAEVSVACVAPNGSPFHFAQPTVRTIRTGGFEVKGITTSQIYVAVRVGPDDAWFIREVGAANFNHLRLPRRHRIGFRLVSSHRSPIGSPEVTLVPGHQALARARRGMVEPLVSGDRLTVKEDGRFQIRDVLPGHYTLVVRCAGHATRAIPLHVTRSFEDDVLYLEPAVRVKISVCDQDFEPVEGAEVFARSLKPAGPLAGITLACGPTDSKGNVTIDSLVGRSVAITAVHPRHGIAHRVEALTDGAEWRLRLAAPGHIAGRVVSRSPSETSSQRSWTVQMFPVAGNRALETAFAFAALDDSNRFTRATLAEALYDVRAIPDLAGIHPKEDLISRLQFIGQRTPVVTVDSLAGQWTILATQAQAQEPDPTPVAPPPAPRGLLTLTGTVQRPDGQPAKGAALRLSPSGSSNGARAQTFETDSRGQFHFHDLAEGKYAIEARGQGTGRCRSRIVIAHGAVKPITVKLIPGVFVEGRLAKPGKLGEIQFILQDRSGNWLDAQGRIARLDQIDALLKEVPRVRLDAAGRFAKTVLPPGRYCVTPAGAGVIKAAEYNAYVTIGDRDLPGIVIGPLIKRSVLWPIWFGGSRNK
jgi:protocatechuate 3,4-dioxygenase beta subunit